MSFLSSVLLTNGILSLILALVTSAGCLIMGIAIVRNPLNVTRKAIHCIEHVGLVLSLLAGMVLLPYFGVTEILQGVNDNAGSSDFPSFISVLADFLIASKLAIYLIVCIERCIAYRCPHFHRAKVTKRSTLGVSILSVTFCFFISCLSFTGIDEKSYYNVFIHLFCSSSWVVFLFVTWLTYRKLKNRTRIAPNESVQLPQIREKAEFEKARNASIAKKHVHKAAKFYMPVFLTVLPWYVVKCTKAVCEVCMTTEAGFFWQRFSISIAFLTDAYYPLTFYREYGKTVKYIFCNRWFLRLGNNIRYWQ